MEISGVTSCPRITGCSWFERAEPAASGDEASRGTGTDTTAPASSSSITGAEKQLSEEEQLEVKELKRRDAEVKAHEMAHVAAGGQYVRGGASFEYQTGPDGKRYAVGGEVSIDTSPISGNPKATIRKMQAVKRAALAPAQPSGQDRAVAAAASQAEAQARQQLQSEQNSQEPPETTLAEKNERRPGVSGYNADATAVPSDQVTIAEQLDLVA